MLRAAGRRWCSTAGGQKGRVQAMGLRSPLDIDEEDLKRARAARAFAEEARARAAAAAQAPQPFPGSEAAGDGEYMTPEEHEAAEEAEEVAAMHQSKLITFVCFIGNFAVCVVTLFGLTFTAVDMGVPIPPLEAGRKRVGRDPKSVTVSWLPCMPMPSLVVAVMYTGFTRHHFVQHLRRFRKDLQRFMSASKAPLKPTTARREGHASGITRLARRENTEWTEKGVDMSVLLKTGNMRKQ
eukprot:TRINITY_DN25359_c0_g1_i1.p4 TRINITY_DN25359_c0_g1~~TRINITY_DN25359_c0_g1_i1.p4  ORF type:complete len:239 (+),score=97.78 TRINITY_DN25359_c0_g1_i1:2-718(+)